MTLRPFHRVMRILLAGLMMVFSALVFLQVLIRYVIHLGLFGLNDVTALMAVWMYFLGAGYAALWGEHIVAGLLDVMLPDGSPLHKVISVLAATLSAATMLVFAFWATEYGAWALERGAVTDELKLPRVHLAVPIALGCLMMAVFFARNGWRAACGLDASETGDA